jgi:DNA helicase-2/ATP-dependent DNA helicase PcrA
LKEKDLIQFGDMVPLAAQILRENGDIRRGVMDKFSYCLADEFQDTNRVQLNMLLSMTSGGRITVVGDRDQLVYKFQGLHIFIFIFQENLSKYIYVRLLSNLFMKYEF